MQSRAGNSDAADIDRSQVRNWRQDACPADLHLNVFDYCRCLAARKLECNSAPRRFSDNAELVKNRVFVHLYDNAVNKKREFIADRKNMLPKCLNIRKIMALLRMRVSSKPK